MKVLFLHPNTPDYLTAGLFHGLRSLLGPQCVDLPRFDGMYAPLTPAMRSKIRGRGFTLYGLLPDLPELAAERFFIWQHGIVHYDYYIIADIWRHYPVLEQLRKVVPAQKIVIIDPADTPRLFPYNDMRQRWPHLLRLRNLLKGCKMYYKREWMPQEVGSSTGLPPLLVKALAGQPLPLPVMPISFSIPAQKITVVSPAAKTKDFVHNIVDAEVSEALQGSFHTPLGQQQYAFDTEEAYYADIQTNRYGITTRRSGWDCLRHYELAANGALLCFKNLQHEPAGCAPHGLQPASNCIAYNNFAHLKQQLETLSPATYQQLQQQGYAWVQQHTTLALAKRFMEELNT